MRSKQSRDAGFTLIEVLVVLVILGLTAALVLARGPVRSAGMEARTAASEVAETLRLGRSVAIAGDRPAAVTLDVASHWLTLDGARRTRRGEEVVAGLPFTDLAVRSPRGAGTVCLTEDGVTLRADGEVDGRRGAFTASSVSYGPQQDGLFRVPPEYMQFSMPKLGRVK